MLWFVFVVVLLVAGGFWLNAHEQKEANKRRAAKDAGEAEKARIAQLQDLSLQGAIADRRTEGWQDISRARLMHQEGQPPCLFMRSQNGLLLRIEEFSPQGEVVTFLNPHFVNVNQVISLHTARPKTQKSRRKSVPIAVTKTENDRSPVVRGLVGGAILGPAGVVLGAASGLKSSTTTDIRHEQVYEHYEALGAQQLIVGTNDPDRPLLKLKFDPPELADEWLYRIRALQATR